eukprot:1172750-Prorocentrum_minimum.AAC.1
MSVSAVLTSTILIFCFSAASALTGAPTASPTTDQLGVVNERPALLLTPPPPPDFSDCLDAVYGHLELRSLNFNFNDQQAILTGSGIPFKAEDRIHDLLGWGDAHQILVNETQTAIREGRQKLDLLFLGDSITEHFRGSSVGFECSPDEISVQCSAAAEVWNKNFCNLNTMALGIAHDRTEHLLWRLQNGEAAGLEPALIVVLIGTNNFGVRAGRNGSSDAAVLTEELLSFADEVELGVMEVVNFLKTSFPSSQILVLALLPRGFADQGLFTQPSIYSPAFEKLNSDMQVEVDKLNDDNDDVGSSNDQVKRYGTLDCGSVFLTPTGDIDPPLMHDALHPSGDSQVLSVPPRLPPEAEIMKMGVNTITATSGYQALLDECLVPEFIRRGIVPTPSAEEVGDTGNETTEEAAEGQASDTSLLDILDEVNQVHGMLGGFQQGLVR